nr:metallophosphoesterase [Brevibacillus fulvus]
MLVVVLLFLLFFRAYRNTFQATINYIPVVVHTSAENRTEPFAPLQVLHLSDLHMENISVKAEEVVDRFRNEPVDIIAITGDLLDREKNIGRAIEYVKTIMKLQPAYGTFVVFGNHDYKLSAEKLTQLKAGLERIGSHVLVNETITFQRDGQKIHVIGVDDYSTRHSDLAKAYNGVDQDGLKLVLTHDPNLVLQMKDFTFDYLLSGHFHGGQIHWPKPYHLAKMGKLPRMNMVKGLHYYEGRPFYISEGLGQTGVNIRVRSRPEITLHTLQADFSPIASFVQEAAVGLAPK